MTRKQRLFHAWFWASVALTTQALSAETTKDVIVCRDIKVAMQGIALMKANDYPAFEKLIHPYVMDKSCGQILAKTRVQWSYIRPSRYSMYVCLRPQGEPDCLWAMIDAEWFRSFVKDEE